MLRFILIILVIAVFFSLLNRLKIRGTAGNAEAAKLSSSKMVSCNYCQLYVIQEDALVFKGLHYCCKDHQEKALERIADE